MKRKLRQKLSLLLALAIMCPLGGCSGPSQTTSHYLSSEISSSSLLEDEDVIGEWYDHDNKRLKIGERGVYEREIDDDEIEEGVWKILDSKTITLNITQGSYTKKIRGEVKTNEKGTYIDFDERYSSNGHGYGNHIYYKNKYPSESSTSTDSYLDDTSTTYDEKISKTELDPFDGATFEVTGVSPYLTLTVNNSGCQSEVQNCVTYTLDKEQYANGDTAVITASFMEPNSSGNYTLAETEKTYSIKDQPEYITSLDGIDLTTLESELDDYMTAKTSESIDTNYLFNIGAHDGVTSVNYISVDKIELQEKYLISLKKNKIENNDKFFNSINYIYQISTTTGLPEIGYSPKDSKIYVNVSAYNVVKYPDGSLKWGLEDPDSYQFEYQSSDKGVNNLVTTTITVLSDNYNITKIDIGNKNSKPQQ